MPQILMPYTVHLDHTLRVTPLSTLFAKGDRAAHRFELTILRAGVQEDLTGCTVMYKFYRMAEKTVVDVDGTIEDRKAVAVLNKACYDYIGRFVLTIVIKKGEEETTVFYGDGYMHGQRADTAISGEYIIYDINTLLEKIAEIDAATQAANTATSNANTATANANTATGKANTAATNANTAKDAANAAAGKINNMTVSATPVSTGTATAELSMVDGHYHLALGLPKGDTGATPQISVQVQTGEAGSEASVSVSGTAENPVIHLTIPRGDVGNIGALTINGKAPDGSGAVALTAEDVGALAEGGTAADSSKLGGVAASGYALKTDTAPDSIKLGGKAPEYYVQPRNLLDNSDFTNLVAQAGIGGNHGTVAYAADRWILDSGTVSYTAGTGLTLNGTIRQKLEVQPTGQTSAFIGMVSGTASISYADGEVTITSGGGVLKWAALYEGSYTADTMPPYAPKGYAAEFAECRRYYKRFTSPYASIFGAGYVTSSTKNIFINPPDNYPMRKNKPSCAFRGTITVRGINGYVADSYSDAVIAVYEEATGCVSSLLITRGDSSAWNATNNTPVTVQLHGDSVLELIADL